MTVVIRDTNLIDGTGRSAQEGAVILIEGQRIAAVGSKHEVAIPHAQATVINAEGRTMLPGLVDLHVGLVSLEEGEKPYGINEKNVAASVLRAAASGRRCLNFGVTTVRVDLSGHHGIFALKEAFAKGVLEGPRTFVPGRSICITGGHGWRGHCREADGADEVRKAVREELKAGADWIKLMATAGAGTPTERVEDNQMTLEELRAGVEEAHKKGKFVFAHVACAEGARNCIGAGVDSIEHGIFLEEDIVKAMKEKGIFLVPTLGAYRRLVERGEKGLVPDFMYQKAKEVVERHTRSFHMALEAGVKIAAGTDSGYYWYPAGDSLLYELELMNQEGMSPMQTLISATSRAAECLRMEGEFGTVEVAKLADIVIVEGDPLANISNLRNTWMVFKEGRIVFRK